MQVKWREYIGQGRDRLDPIEELEATWRALEASPHVTIFQSFLFCRHWAEIIGASYRIRIWACSDPPLLLPLAETHHGATLLGDGLFDYLDLIGEATPDQQIELAAKLRAGGTMRTLRFTGLRANSRNRVFWNALGARSEFYCEALGVDATQQVVGTWAQAHKRTRRRLRRVLESGAVVRLEETGKVEAMIGWMVTRKQEQAAARGAVCVLGAAEARWLMAVLRSEPGPGEVWTLRARDGEPMAALLCWRHRGTRYAYTICYEERAAALSPGVLLLYAVTERSLAERCSLDFLTGDQPFKRRFASRSQTVYKVIAK